MIGYQRQVDQSFQEVKEKGKADVIQISTRLGEPVNTISDIAFVSVNSIPDRKAMFYSQCKVTIDADMSFIQHL